VEGLWDKYHVAMARIEDDRTKADTVLKKYLAELGYAK
jgi:hypothetical protein